MTLPYLKLFALSTDGTPPWMHVPGETRALCVFRLHTGSGVVLLPGAKYLNSRKTRKNDVTGGMVFELKVAHLSASLQVG